jgi:metal-responsive CopG/Arc/MetJ family transcriptional regulator
MPSKGYVTIALPKIIIEQVEEIIKDKKHGYVSRPEFIKEAIREKIRTLKR